ncbi:MAG: pesticin C-terminus-like muramidase [Gammaproteobacteria bacterium]|nr:pesticin C-terminus-like muramidase [Gammaproteobacteria bacterium]MCF6258722.1 pesticin C-terminus-like muramidase [Gammaproteobacteria bacterium]
MTDKIDYKFLSDREGGRKLLGYVPNEGGSKSGVTIATGFDLGQRNETNLKKLKLSKTLIDKLKPYLGLTKKNAVDAIKKKPLMINDAQALEIVKSRHIASIANKYNTAIEKYTLLLLFHCITMRNFYRRYLIANGNVRNVHVPDPQFIT